MECSEWPWATQQQAGKNENQSSCCPVYLIRLLSIHFSERNIYFHALSSLNEFYVPNFVLQNETWSTSPESYNDFHYLGNRGPNGQSTTEQLDPHTNVVFYTQVNKDSIQCWNANTIYTPDNQGLVDSDSEKLVFPNDLKVVDGNLWVLSDRMPVFLFGKLDRNDVNYRILKGPVSELLLGTPCAPKN